MMSSAWASALRMIEKTSNTRDEVSEEMLGSGSNRVPRVKVRR